MKIGCWWCKERPGVLISTDSLWLWNPCKGLLRALRGCTASIKWTRVWQGAGLRPVQWQPALATLLSDILSLIILPQIILLYCNPLWPAATSGVGRRPWTRSSRWRARCRRDSASWWRGRGHSWGSSTPWRHRSATNIRDYSSIHNFDLTRSSSFIILINKYWSNHHPNR